MSIKVFQNLLNIEKYNKIEFILKDVENLSSKQNIYDRDLTTYYNYNLITVDLQALLEKKWVSTYTSDLIELIQDINQRNDNEEKVLTDTDQDKIYKDDLYFRRLENIKDEKISFLNNYKNLKRFKGTKSFIERVVRFYVNTKLKNQYNLNLSSEITTGSLVPSKRYRIIETTLNYFGKGLVRGNIFIASDSKVLSVNNSVKEITSTDTTLKTSGSLKQNSYYIIDQVQDDYFFDGNVIGNRVINDGTLNPATSDNVVIEKVPVTIDQIKRDVYIIQSIFEEDVWVSILKPIVHPIGWISYYYNINSFILETEFTQCQESIIYSELKFMNLGYYAQNELENNYNRNYDLIPVQNLSLDDMIKSNDFVKTSNSNMIFSLIKSSIGNGIEVTENFNNYILELWFSEELDTSTVNISNLYIEGDIIGVLPSIYDIVDNLVRVNFSIGGADNFTINITSNLKNIFGENCLPNTIEFFTT